MLALGAASAAAAPIRGSFAISGIVIPVNGATTEPIVDNDGYATFDAANGNVATGLDFLNQDLSAPTTGAINAFSFEAAGSSAYTDVPQFAQVSLSNNTLTFDLEKVFVEYRDANALTVTGSGFFNWAGYDRTPGSVEFTAPGILRGGRVGAPGTAPTPEPASLFLLGTGALLGLRSYRKRRLAA